MGNGSTAHLADARTLAHYLLAMAHGEFGAAFDGSPMKRARLQTLTRNAAVVLGNSIPRGARAHRVGRSTIRSRWCASMRRERLSGVTE